MCECVCVYTYIQIYIYMHVYIQKGYYMCNFLFETLWKRQNNRHFWCQVLKTQNLEQVNPLQYCEIVMYQW